LRDVEAARRLAHAARIDQCGEDVEVAQLEATLGPLVPGHAGLAFHKVMGQFHLHSIPLRTTCASVMGPRAPSRDGQDGSQVERAMNRRAFLSGAAALGLGAAAFSAARAQSFPSNVIRFVVPASASTPPDILARIVANALSEVEGWRTIVENKPGAVMTLGIGEVLKQPADGYTLFSVTTPITATPALMPNASI